MLIECVPNFSEGRRSEVIDAIADVIRETKGVQLLHVDPNEAANRTVYTFVGEPDAVCEAAFSAVAKAKELIDMSVQKGEHPRMGACDVCPLIPLRDITIEETIVYAEKLSQRIADELNLSVYSYEYSSSNEKRKRLEQIRKGEYEALSEKMGEDEWRPDFGPTEFNPQFGAMVLGARQFLLAYNINLDSKDESIAKAIAGRLRESGALVVEDGKNVRKKGLFKALKAIGWYIEDFGCAQVSFNITNYNETSIFAVFEKTKELATEMGCNVNGSELVGMLPLDAALKSANRYITTQNGSGGSFTDLEKVDILAQEIGLSSVKGFDPSKQIIEFVAGL